MILTSNTLATWYEELTHWKKPWCWERLKAGEEGDDIRCDGWMASPTWWTWVWARSRIDDGHEFEQDPGFMMDKEAWCAAVYGSQRVRHDWAAELNWTDIIPMYWIFYFFTIRIFQPTDFLKF